MRFLDIDLDAFLNSVAHWPEGGRLDSEDFIPWSEERLRDFLERQCLLSREGRTGAGPAMARRESPQMGFADSGPDEFLAHVEEYECLAPESGGAAVERLVYTALQKCHKNGNPRD